MTGSDAYLCTDKTGLSKWNCFTLKRFKLMKHLLTFFAVLSAMTGHAQQVETIEFGLPIHSMRIYDDTVFAATNQGMAYYSLKDKDGVHPYTDVCVVVYDFVKNGSRLLEAGSAGQCYYQHPQQPSRVYKSQPIGSGVMGYTFSKSADFGRCWWTTGYEQELLGRPSMAFNPMNTDEVLLYGLNEYVDCICPFLLRSADGLETFADVDFQMGEDRLMTFLQLVFSPDDDGVLMAATTKGLARSNDHGLTWKYLTGTTTLPGYVSIGEQYFVGVCFDDMRPNLIYALEMAPRNSVMSFTPYYIYRSVDGGSSWQVVGSVNMPDSSGPTTGMRGFQCYQGKLVWWADCRLFVISEPQLLIPITNTPTAMPAPSADVEQPQMVYDLLGRSHKNGRIRVEKGSKYIAK
jgi:hypothetical protein